VIAWSEDCILKPTICRGKLVSGFAGVYKEPRTMKNSKPTICSGKLILGFAGAVQGYCRSQHRSVNAKLQNPTRSYF